MTTLISQIEQLKQVTNEASQQYNELKRKADSTHKVLIDLTTKYNDEKKKSNRLGEQVVKQERVKKNLNDSIQLIENDLDQLNQQLKVLNEKKNDAHKRFDDTREMLLKEVPIMNEQYESLRAKYSPEIVKRTIVDLKVKLAMLQRNVDQNAMDIDQRESLLDEKNKLNQELEELKASEAKYNLEMEQLEKQRDELKNEIETMKDNSESRLSILELENTRDELVEKNNEILRQVNDQITLFEERFGNVLCTECKQRNLFLSEEFVDA
jgi:chromosome segregation ATPase